MTRQGMDSRSQRSNLGNDEISSGGAVEILRKRIEEQGGNQRLSSPPKPKRLCVEYSRRGRINRNHMRGDFLRPLSIQVLRLPNLCGLRCAGAASHPVDQPVGQNAEVERAEQGYDQRDR